MDALLKKITVWFVTVTVVLALWVVSTIIYRYALHPLAAFPGPRLAAITYWYEFYYDIGLGRQYTYKLRELNQEYGRARRDQVHSFSINVKHLGPILRINPDEIHIDDPDYYDEVFNNTGKVDKPFKEANVFGPYPAVRYSKSEMDSGRNDLIVSFYYTDALHGPA